MDNDTVKLHQLIWGIVLGGEKFNPIKYSTGVKGKRLRHSYSEDF